MSKQIDDRHRKNRFDFCPCSFEASMKDPDDQEIEFDNCQTIYLSKVKEK